MEIKIGDRIFVVVREEEPMEAAIVPAEVTAIKGLPIINGWPQIQWKQIYPGSNGAWLKEDQQKDGTCFVKLLDAKLHLIKRLQKHPPEVLYAIRANLGKISTFNIEPDNVDYAESRRKALEAIANDKSLVIVMRSHASIEACDRATFDTVFANDGDIESATWDDVYRCPSCGADVLIFEDICPSCGKVPWPEEPEMPEQGESIHVFHLDSLSS